PTTFCPKEDGDYMLLGQDHGENHKEIARQSKHDADAYDAFNHDVTKVLQAIKPLMDEAPPDFWSDDPRSSSGWQPSAHASAASIARSFTTRSACSLARRRTCSTTTST